MNLQRYNLRALVAVSLAMYVSILWAQPKAVDGVLTDPAGMSLYWWDNDLTVPGKIMCTGPCTLTWPPFFAADDARTAGDYAIITREDGKKQWAYKGRPLYRWLNDQKPGDRTGDGFRGGTWHLAKP